jgi:hypothetical protein
VTQTFCSEALRRYQDADHGRTGKAAPYPDRRPHAPADARRPRRQAPTHGHADGGAWPTATPTPQPTPVPRTEQEALQIATDIKKKLDEAGLQGPGLEYSG